MSTLPLPSKCIQTLTGHIGPIHTVCYNTNGTYCLTGGQDKSIRLWNPSNGLCIKTYTGHGWEVLGIQVASDNSRFVSGGGDKTVMLWDVATGKTIKRYSGHYQRINCVDFNSEATIIGSGSYDATLRLWDTRSQNRFPVQILDEFKDSITSIQISGHEILSGCVDGCIRVHDIRMGRLITDLVGYPITSVRFSGDKMCILASTLDSKVRLFDKEDGQILNEYIGITNTQYKVGSTLTNTDAYVISGSEDGTIVMWDLVEGQIVRTLPAHSKVVTCVIYHPKDISMISVSVDGVAKVWTN